MDEKDIEQVRSFLLQCVGCFEAHHVTTFKACRYEKNSGAVQTITVEISDAGPCKSPRYSVSAFDQFDRLVAGNPEDSILDALTYAHWNELDAPRKIDRLDAPRPRLVDDDD